MFERYTESARRAIFYARWWALNRAVAKIEVSDLILGIAQAARRPDHRLGWMNLDSNRMTALFAPGVKCVKNPKPKDLPLSDSTKRALAYAAMEADLDERHSLAVYHLLRGVLRTEDPAAKAMLEAGYSLEALREGSRHANQILADASRKLRLKNTLRDLWWGIWWRISHLPWYVGIAFVAFIAAILYLRSQN